MFSDGKAVVADLTIGARVGRNAPKNGNKEADVRVVQTLLLRHARWLSPETPPSVNGSIADRDDDPTVRAIRAFQRNAVVFANQDGAVDPNGMTLRFLNRANIPGLMHKVFNTASWTRPATGLTIADFTTAATTLNCEVAAIQAVAEVETPGAAWDDQGRPRILFERHYFRDLTHGAYNGSHPDLSGPQGGYGPESGQYPKLARAAMLNENAALRSASWGRFQNMGRYYAACGFASVEAFVDAMVESEQRHLGAFVAFIASRGDLVRAIRAKDWATFAQGYNGPNYASNAYDTKMAAAYQRYSPPPPPANAPRPGAVPIPTPRPAAGGR